MPITFKSKHSPNILMLETAALQMLKMMGRNGSVPSALSADDVPAALERLREQIELHAGQSNRSDEDDEREHDRGVSVAHRALPLINMLVAAAEHGDHVIWDR
ncbi:MAG: DUF1840 domain-containing protein [Proteobacteria bacterium]|nr:DUF1840 domain-containing protein [Pseudomonadota bacterium]